MGLKNLNDFISQFATNNPGVNIMAAIKKVANPETQYQMDQVQKQVDKFKLQNKEREVFGHVISK